MNAPVDLWKIIEDSVETTDLETKLQQIRDIQEFKRKQFLEFLISPISQVGAMVFGVRVLVCFKIVPQDADIILSFMAGTYGTVRLGIEAFRRHTMTRYAGLLERSVSETVEGMSRRFEVLFNDIFPLQFPEEDADPQ